MAFNGYDLMKRTLATLFYIIPFIDALRGIFLLQQNKWHWLHKQYFLHTILM
jgi:hypothetical protein